MHRIDGTTAAAGGLFTRGDPQAGVPPTIVSPEWLNAVQEEIAGVVEAAGLGPDKDDSGQLLKALREHWGELMPFTQGMAGSVPRAPQDKMREIFSVRDAGDIPAALSDAATLVETSGYGVAVYFPPDTYDVDASIATPNGVHLVSNGAKLLPGDGVLTVVTLDGLRQNISGFTIVVPNNGVGVRAKTHFSKIRDNYFIPKSAPAVNATAIKLDTTDGLDGCWLTDVLDNTIDLNQATTATGCVAIHLLGPANRINVERNTIAGFSGIGIWVEDYDDGAQRPQLVNIRGNDIESMGGDGPNFGIQLDACYAVNICENYFEGIGGVSSRLVNAGVGGQARMVTVENNYMLDSGAAGLVAIAFDRCTAPHVERNYWPGAAGTYVTITANTVASEAGIVPGPYTTWDLLKDEAATPETPGAAFVTPAVAKSGYAIGGLAENIYTFYVFFVASNADTYTFQLEGIFGGTFATMQKVTPGAGSYSIGVMFTGAPNNPVVKFKAAAGGGLAIKAAVLQAL